MANLRLYTLVYVALIGLAVSKWAFFEVLEYNIAVSLTMVAAAIKTSLIVGYYQHLRYEPRILTVLIFTAFVGVLILSAAASFSIL